MDPKLDWKKVRKAAADLAQAVADEDAAAVRAAVKKVEAVLVPPKPMTPEDSKALADINRKLAAAGRNRRVL